MSYQNSDGDCLFGCPAGSACAGCYRTRQDEWTLLLDTTYPREDIHRIDCLQLEWSDLLCGRIPGLKREILFEVLLCMREAVLNGLQHGCSEGQYTRVKMRCCEHAKQIRVMVSDPGPGHRFNPQTRVDDALADGHRGLLIMSQFPAEFHSIQRGATVSMDFPLALED